MTPRADEGIGDFLRGVCGRHRALAVFAERAVGAHFVRRICRRCAGAGVTDDRQYATAPHVCSITYRYAYTETYYMQFL